MASTGSVSDLVASNGKADQVYPCILMSHLISYLSNASCDVWINLWNPDPPSGLLQMSGGATQMRPCKWTCSLCQCKHWFVLWCFVDLMHTKNLHVRLLFHCLSGRCYCTMSAALLVSLSLFFYSCPNTKFASEMRQFNNVWLGSGEETTRPFPLHPLRGEHVCVTSFLHLSASCYIYLFSLPICLHARHFCDFLREEFIEMRVLQPDGSASTSLFSLPAPPLICSLSSLLSFKCHFVWYTGVRTWEDLQGRDSGQWDVCFIICLIQDLSSLGKARLPRTVSLCSAATASFQKLFVQAGRQFGCGAWEHSRTF